MHDVYRELDAEPPTAFSGKKSTTLYAGLRRMEATENQTTGPRHSGKQPLPYSTYEELCRRTLARDDGGFTHLFLTAQWNLVCRSVSVESLSSQHVVSADDAISCIFYKTKTDQEGRSAKTPRHVYANPTSPATCVVTALAIYLACHSALRAGLLFPGSKQKKRFGAALKQIISVNETSDYGTHSIRKGAATFACSGNTTDPSVASICSCCDWSLGSVLDRYLRYDDAGDQYIGRLVAGLPQNSADFAALPPHFRDNVSSEVIACIRDTFPALAREKNMKSILKLCLASLTFHAAFLKSSLPKTHPLMSCALFRDPATLQRLQKQLVIAGPTWMRPTGIPPYVHMFTKIEETKNAIEALKAELLDGISTMLDARALGGSSLTTAAMKDMFREVLQDAGLHNTHGIPPSTAPADLVIPLRYPMMWGGGIHLLPEQFEFPSVDCLAAWKLWWFGNTTLAYPSDLIAKRNAIGNIRREGR
ncbi:hypothetical protein BBJ28_00015778 [Nothophytophthora sp. Chile5]|nr:hypothetical protein BBJ28_00015778 [Nothophytophthora sp. Chile5]